MHLALGILGVALILIILLDGFESIVLPRRVGRRFRPARLFYIVTWKPWAALARRVKTKRRQNTLLGLFGPSSMIGLLILWALSLVFGFALVEWSIGAPLHATDGHPTLFDYLYMSGVTFFTLGYGDVTPTDTSGRIVAVIEAGVGFGFLAVVIGYLPVLYSVFSRREVSISLLDARAGSPPTAFELLRRLARAGDLRPLDTILQEWERWSAELLESHISFPVLAYYRSQHDNQSWLGAITAILDTCAIVMAGIRGVNPYHAGLTFAIARHAIVDMALIFNTHPTGPTVERLPGDCIDLLRKALKDAGYEPFDSPGFDQKLAELRAMYEPFVNALSKRFLFDLPAMKATAATVDNWQTSAWMRRVPGFVEIAGRDDHFD
ncbi:MAG: potassium channel family protein [Bryobacteraceae bacterium]